MLPDVPKAVESARLAQIVALVRDNQFATAAVCFILWQADVVSTVVYHIGGVC